MKQTRRIAGALVLSAAAFGLVARAQQSPPAPTIPPPAAPTGTALPSAAPPRRAIPDEKLPAGAPQFKTMYLDHALFQPDKSWTYEGADDDRPDAHNVEQNSFVRIGNRIVGSHGGLVSYTADTYPDAKAAHAAFLRRVPKPFSRPNGVRVNRRLRQGDEAVESVMTALHEREAESVLRQTFARFGKYVVEIGGEADMKAIGERPAHGGRPWMCEPIYEQVRAAAFDKWNHRRDLLTAP